MNLSTHMMLHDHEGSVSGLMNEIMSINCYTLIHPGTVKRYLALVHGAFYGKIPTTAIVAARGPNKQMQMKFTGN